MTEISTTKLLVPAAGFGKRVGSPTAKELLILKNEVKPLIEWSLELSKKYQLPAVIISREDKVDLNNYLASISRKYMLEICLITSSQEWPDTILQAEAHWAEKNIVMLPDTRFGPEVILEKMNTILTKDRFVFATFEAEILNTWGVIRNDKNKSFIAEKPNVYKTTDQAWGLFGFQKDSGKKLLTAMLQSKGDFIPFSDQPTTCFPLNAFYDVGRKGVEPFKA
jgi:hypothetical protein